MIRAALLHVIVLLLAAASPASEQEYPVKSVADGGAS
jgi:hypothetical protein